MVQFVSKKRPKKIMKRIKDFKGSKETDFAKKVCQNFKILLTQKGLFSDVKEFRKKWNINIDINARITDPSEPKIEDEEDPIVIASLEDLKSSPMIQAIIEKMKWERENPITNKEIRKREEKFQDLNNLLKIYKIPNISFDLFKNFVYSGTIPSYFFKRNNQTGAHFFTTRDADGDPCMAIRIFPETTIKDMDAEWANIEIARDKFLGFNLSKHLDRKNIDRDLRIMQLKYCGLKSESIVRQIKEEFPSKKPFTYQEVNRVIYEINQLHLDKPLVLP